MSASSPALSRFLRYVTFDTQSSFEGDAAPSTEKQLRLAEALTAELRTLGLADARVGEGGVVYAHLAATPGCESAPTIGFIAHIDTSPDAPGAGVKPQILTVTDDDPVLNPETDLRFDIAQFPDILKYKGEDVVFTDGTTLLGADDKAGIAAIMTMLERLAADPSIPHARIAVAFTPDEEIGRGTEHFDLETFGAAYATTFDGGELGELQFENFNAATAVVRIEGVGVHPGHAKDKMVNAIRIAAAFIDDLSIMPSPEETDGHVGFIHPNHLTSSVTEAVITILIRDHDREKFEGKKEGLQELIKRYAAEHPKARFMLDIEDSYANMRTYIERTPKVLDIVRTAFADAGVTPREIPIRGGTDGARLSEMGLPCPNIFTGGLNFHGVHECLPVRSLDKAVDVAVALAARSADVTSLV